MITAVTGRNNAVCSLCSTFFCTFLMRKFSEGITATNEPRNDVPKGLGDFQRRSNRDRDRGWSDRRNYDRGQIQQRGWDATPSSSRGSASRDAPSVRVPNVPWDATPRSSRGEDGWGGTKNRRWDAPTPRAARGASPDDDNGAFGLDAREWEEEQVKLDRDWYTGAEEGGVAGDDEHNPLAQYEDLSALKEAEIATKQTARLNICLIRTNLIIHYRKKYPPDKPNM